MLCSCSGRRSKVGGRREPLQHRLSLNRIQHPCSGFSPTRRTTWLAITLALAFLLLLSTAANVSLFLGSRATRSRHLDGAYVYYPLQEVNGEHPAAEKEQLGDSCNPFKD